MSDPALNEERDSMPLAELFFFSIYIISIKLLIGAIILAVALGFNGVYWYAAIPAWAAAWYTLRVFKTAARNWLDDVRHEQTNLDLQIQYTPPEDTDESAQAEETSRRKPAMHLLVAVAMLAVSAFWYGIGALLQLVF